jgi:hypothetical protein
MVGNITRKISKPNLRIPGINILGIQLPLYAPERWVTGFVDEAHSIWDATFSPPQRILSRTMT